MKLQELFEMAAPSAIHRSKIYYHGTSSEQAGEGILKNGIQPGSVVLPKKNGGKGPNLEPVKGKVYITTSLRYAQIYAIGGDIAGSHHEETGYGYLFVIDGSELSDIQPDEDSVGEMIYYALRGERKEPFLQRYVNILSSTLTDGQFRKFKNAEYVMWAHAGKKLLKNMSDDDKLAFIEAGAHIANSDAIQIKEAWRIDKSKIENLKRDASNFFELAEKVR